MKKEIRIPILGVIEESETLNGNERYFLDHYPHGEGVYLVKIGSCYMELRDVHIRNEKTPNDRIKCDFAIYPIRSSAVVEEIKKEHEATLKDYIEECCVKILTSVNANRDDVRNVDEKMSVLFPCECPKASAIISSGIPIEKAIVAQVCRAQYIESDGKKGLYFI